jgi:2-polyprenyl-3-methyl-5-hydroxy-6-metoxy-1,4-benzoquinol methylase
MLPGHKIDLTCFSEGIGMNTAYIVLPPTLRDQSIPSNAEFCQSFMRDQLRVVKAFFPTDCKITCGNMMDWMPDADQIILIRSGVIALLPSLERLGLAYGNHAQSIIAGPVMVNGAVGQISPFPFSYSDIDTFQELAEWLMENRGESTRNVSSLSDDVFCCASSFIERFPVNLPINELSHHDIWHQSIKVVVESSIAHSFSNYYQHPRMDLIELLPDKVGSVLDVGCAEGALGRYLKQVKPSIKVAGIESDPIAGRKAQKVYDRVYIQPVENLSLMDRFDCIICGDILEHLIDPLAVLKAFHGLLNEDGALVGSVPNIGHWSVIRGLVNGHFQYLPAGILCWDHLRFFTEHSLRKMLIEAGYHVDYLGYKLSSISPEGSRFIKRLGMDEGGKTIALSAEQFLFKSIKTQEPHFQMYNG